MLAREVRRRPFLSKALWVPSIFAMVIASRPISGWFSGTATSNAATNADLLDEAFFVLAIIASFVITSRRKVNWGKFLIANVPLMLLYLYFMFSVFWSPDPLWSGRRILKDFALLVVVAAIRSEREPSEAVRAVFFRVACVLIPLSLLFDRYFPRFAREYSLSGEPMLSGVTRQKNSLGELVFVLCIFIFWDFVELRKRRGRFRIRDQWDHILLFMMALLLLHQSQSKTSLVCLGIGCALSLRGAKRASPMVSKLAFWGALSTPFLLFFTQEFGDLIAPFVKAMGRDMTFTGRANIWHQITGQTVNPIIGYGYWDFWGGPVGQEIAFQMQTSIPNAHCGYIDLYLDGGIIGLIFACIFLVAYGVRLTSRRKQDRTQCVRLALFCAAIVYNLAESSFLRLGLLWFTTLVMIVDFPQPRLKARRRDVMQQPDALPEMQTVSSAVMHGR
jgi:exopolysaccharide production protein ExoQ